MMKHIGGHVTFNLHKVLLISNLPLLLCSVHLNKPFHSDGWARLTKALMCLFTADKFIDISDFCSESVCEL